MWHHQHSEVLLPLTREHAEDVFEDVHAWYVTLSHGFDDVLGFLLSDALQILGPQERIGRLVACRRVLDPLFDVRLERFFVSRDGLEIAQRSPELFVGTGQIFLADVVQEEYQGAELLQSPCEVGHRFWRVAFVDGGHLPLCEFFELQVAPVHRLQTTLEVRGIEVSQFFHRLRRKRLGDDLLVDGIIAVAEGEVLLRPVVQHAPHHLDALPVKIIVIEHEASLNAVDVGIEKGSDLLGIQALGHCTRIPLLLLQGTLGLPFFFSKLRLCHEPLVVDFLRQICHRLEELFYLVVIIVRAVVRKEGLNVLSVQPASQIVHVSFVPGLLKD
mmetsp:Transcript_51972/g.138555  ORF Transcript_51972/g.138555 Transcript_51972/m.138555 type:complete len:329 (-) Transcript_51972:342-1328(-)